MSLQNDEKPMMTFPTPPKAVVGNLTLKRGWRLHLKGKIGGDIIILISNRYVRTPHSLQGFSLVELLVVVGIIAILAIIIFASWPSVLSAANETVCLSNVRSFGSIVLAGITDHGGKLNPPLDQYGEIDCEAFVAPYVTKWLICPVWQRNNPGVTPYGGGNYVINYNIPYYFPNISAIPWPHNRVVLASESYAGDYFSIWLHLDIAMWGIDGDYYSPQEEVAHQGEGRPPQYHGPTNHRGLNMFMLDGSAALIQPDTGSWQPPSATYGTSKNSGYYYDTSQFEDPSQ